MFICCMLINNSNRKIVKRQKLNLFKWSLENMKKTLLLAGVACLMSFNAHAQTYDVKPYVGLDYAYDRADFKKDAKDLKKGFNSGIINAGVRMEDIGIEGFFQVSGENKNHRTDNTVKTKFNAYGLDMYGYLPLGCEKKFELLGSLGAGIYDIHMKDNSSKHNTTRVGYRAGIGAQYNFNENIAARIMGRYNYIGSGRLHSMNEVTAGLRYSF